MAIFGSRCDAVTKKGKRCKRRNVWEVPCAAVYDARATSYRADVFRVVRLCHCHGLQEMRLRQKGERLKLHHGGYLGGFNKYNFGNVVLDKPNINWDKKGLRVFCPNYWAGRMKLEKNCVNCGAKCQHGLDQNHTCKAWMPKPLDTYTLEAVFAALFEIAKYVPINRSEVSRAEEKLLDLCKNVESLRAAVEKQKGEG